MKKTCNKYIGFVTILTIFSLIETDIQNIYTPNKAQTQTEENLLPEADNQVNWIDICNSSIWNEWKM